MNKKYTILFVLIQILFALIHLLIYVHTNGYWEFSAVDNETLPPSQSGKKIAMIIFCDGNLYEFNNYTLKTASYSNKIDFFVFSPKPLAPLISVPNVKVHIIPDLVDIIATNINEALGLPDQINDHLYTQRKEQIKMIATDPVQSSGLRMFNGYIFRDYIKNYTHWGWVDFDVIYGNLDRYLTDEILDYDIITIAEEFNIIAIRGQFTVLKNDEKGTKMFRRVNDKFMQALYAKKVYGFEEREFSKVLLDSDISFFSIMAQSTDIHHPAPYSVIYIEWDNGELYHHLNSKWAPSAYVSSSHSFPLEGVNKPGCEIADWGQNNCIYMGYGQFDAYKNIGGNIMLKRTGIKFPIAFMHFYSTKRKTTKIFNASLDCHKFFVIVDINQNTMSITE